MQLLGTRHGVARMAIAALAVSFGGCSGSGITDPPPADPGISVGGLTFVVVGASYTGNTGVLPAADPTIAAPVVTRTGSLGEFAVSQLSVGAAEPVEAVLILPARWSAYARVALPRNAAQLRISTTRVATSHDQTRAAVTRAAKRPATRRDCAHRGTRRASPAPVDPHPRSTRRRRGATLWRPCASR